MALQVLLTTYAGLSLISLLLMLVLHFFHDRSGYYKTTVYIWAGILLGFVLDGFLAENVGPINHLFGIAFLNFTIHNVAKLAADIYKIPLPLKKLMYFSIGTWLTAIFMHYVLHAGFVAEASVLCIGIVMPALMASYHMMKGWRKTNILDRLFLAFMITDSLHILDYPFLRNVEGTAVFGFSLGIFLIYFASFLMPVIINKRLADDMNQNLERKVKERTQQLITTEEKLLNSTKMAALGEMAGGIAHEINTPLAVIKTVAGQMVDILNDGNPDDYKMLIDMAKTTETTADRIGKIVIGLRQFSRDGSNDGYQLTQVEKLVEETISLCQERFKYNGVKLQLDPIPKELMLECRSVEISQVILNLLSNAFDAAEKEKDNWVRVGVQDQNHWVEFHVTDSGKGISPEDQKKIFQPFYTTKEVGKGTGMGLSISLGIVQNHRGEILIDSQSPNTKFIVRLPKRVPGSLSGRNVA